MNLEFSLSLDRGVDTFVCQKGLEIQFDVRHQQAYNIVNLSMVLDLDLNRNHHTISQ